MTTAGLNPRRTTRAAGGAGRAVAVRAFSLIEMVLVLTIIAIASAIAVPRYVGSIARYRAETAARRVAADLALAASHAADSGKTQSVVFVARSYQMPGMQHLDGKSYGDY